MTKLATLFFCFISLFTFSQKLPYNILDENVAFIYDPTLSPESYPETVRDFCNTIIKSGFNVVGKYLHTDTETSLKEIEIDIKNKKVKYVFLLIDKPNKKKNFKLFLFENNSENQNLVNPKTALYNFDPNSKESLLKEIIKVANKKKKKKTNIQPYNKRLINSFVLNNQDLFLLNTLNNINTLIDGCFLKIEHDKLPDDLAIETLAFIGANKDEYRAYQTINSYFKNKMSNYPYEYKYFNTYKDYRNAGGDKKFKYRIQLTNKDVPFINTLKGSIKHVPTIRELDSESPIPNYSNIPTKTPRDFFTIIIKDNTTNERYTASTKDHLGKSIRYFISQFKEKK